MVNLKPLEAPEITISPANESEMSQFMEWSEDDRYRPFFEQLPDWQPAQPLASLRDLYVLSESGTPAGLLWLRERPWEPRSADFDLMIDLDWFRPEKAFAIKAILDNAMFIQKGGFEKVYLSLFEEQSSAKLMRDFELLGFQRERDSRFSGEIVLSITKATALKLREER